MGFFDRWRQKRAAAQASDKTAVPAPATKAPTKKAAPVKAETYVYITLKGKKYHYTRLCPGLRNSKEVKMELSKARKAGYTACDKCCWDYLHKDD